MTDILDLPNWKVLTSRLDDGTYTIEAEYTQPLQACTKCGVVGKLYRHGPKVVTYRDSPIRGAHVQLAAKVQRYKCRECGGTSLQPLDGIEIDRRMTQRCVEYIKTQCLRDTFTRLSEHNVGDWICKGRVRTVEEVRDWNGYSEVQGLAIKAQLMPYRSEPPQ